MSCNCSTRVRIRYCPEAGLQLVVDVDELGEIQGVHRHSNTDRQGLGVSRKVVGIVSARVPGLGVRHAAQGGTVDSHVATTLFQRSTASMTPCIT